jgi:serine/threonine protein kinase/formylglycine-generating enzyme required for sulfatase activity
MSDSQPNGSQSSTILPLTYVVDACERFEMEWRNGRTPQIQAYLESVRPGQREKLLRELLAVEVELRISHGENPTPAQFRSRYPDWGHAITVAFEKGRSAAEAAREGMARGPCAAGEADRPDLTQRLSAAGVDRPDVTVGSVCYPDSVAGAGSSEPAPQRLGRYEVIRELGRGGFGTVYLARDGELSRPVAIKVPRRGLLSSIEQVESFLAEARNAAGLCHPAIVAVHDVGRFEEFGVFVVFEYVEGRDLAELLGSERLTPSQIATLLIPVAEAAHHAHRGGLVHRDLKPSNILIDPAGGPHITDFGLAIREDLQNLRVGEIAGTPHYMAPEQVRGETHRLDGRTDVWAIGVMLYRALLDRQPFAGRDYHEIFDEILQRDPKPPRQINDRIPRELERICLKCLSKRMADRHETAADLADDLRRWVTAEASTDAFSKTPQAIDAIVKSDSIARIVPKGLRAFEVEDADFFLKLVPGPRDRDGVPEVIRAWKRRIEERDESRTFSVGLLYGPSGSGKSSLLKAGVIPRLSRHVRAIYVPASSSGTEGRIRAALNREIGDLPAGGELDIATAALRERGARHRGSKVLLVLDQFEQWLQSHPDDQDGELVRALRQCDGLGCQCLLLVRDDFWMATTRFLRALDVRLLEGVNSAPVELFDLQHARFVLAELGRALGRMSDAPIAAGSEESRFIETAVNELASPDSRVIPVRLVLFAEMLRHRDWSTKTLRELGGMEGIGETFLEESFSARSAPLPHRAHQRAAQAVLQALLPDARSDIRDRWKPVRLLREASGYADRPADFEELLYVLDNELRMVTPVDPLSLCGKTDDSPARSGETFYQLTHDYLVPSLRQWLSRKQRQTRRGRAELQLASATALWCDRPDSRRLPSLLEWLNIVTFTRRGSWTTNERRMMKRATRRFVFRAVATVVIAGGSVYAIAAMRNRDRAQHALETALRADYSSLPRSLADLRGHSGALRPDLERIETSHESSIHDREVAALALYRDYPRAERAHFLWGRLLKAEPDLARLIGDALAAHPEAAGIENLRSVLLDEASEPGARLRVACVLARLEPASAETMGALAATLAEALIDEQPQNLPRWIKLLGPGSGMLDLPLRKICCDLERDARARSSAAEALAVLLQGEDGTTLAQLTADATPEASRVLLRELVRTGPSDQSVEVLRNVLDERVADADDEISKDALASRQASSGIALAELGQPESLWRLLRHRSDPRLRTLLIQRLAGGALEPRVLIERLSQREQDSVERQAILLAWAEMHRAALAESVKVTVIARARVLYLEDQDAGVHSAAELLLSRWGEPEIREGLQDELRKSVSTNTGLRWTVGPNEHTFAVLEGPLEFQMGAPAGRGEYYGSPVLHSRRIDRSIAVATKEVSLEQFQRFNEGHRNEARYGDEPECAVINISWFAAAEYCNWLSGLAGIPKSQWAYPEKVEPGMVLSEDSVKRTGYRMPTESEWEYLCRAGTRTSRFFGESPGLLTQYAWTCLNSDNRIHPVGQRLPNEFGLFDVLGNAWEWCQDGPVGHYEAHVTDFPVYPPGTKEDPAGDPACTETIDAIDRAHETWRILRGGAFSYAPDRARSAYRDWQPSSDTREYLGLRVIRTLPRSRELSSR